MINNIDITVSICTWNNADRLNITLNNLSKCIVPKSIKWELLIVNNNSTDDTNEIIKNHVNQLPLRVVMEKQQGISYARNTAVNEAKGDFILFTDDDTDPCVNWIQLYWNKFKNNPDQFYGGPIISDFEKNLIINDLYWLYPSSVIGFSLGNIDRAINTDEAFLGANWGFAKNIFNKVGGFNNQYGLNARHFSYMVGEETDLMKRMQMNGYYGYYISDAIVRHFVPEDKCGIEYFLKRARAYGIEQVLIDNKFNISSYNKIYILYYKILLKYAYYRALNKIFLAHNTKYYKLLYGLEINKGRIEALKYLIHKNMDHL